jgi:hypothetical protein
MILQILVQNRLFLISKHHNKLDAVLLNSRLSWSIKKQRNIQMSVVFAGKNAGVGFFGAISTILLGYLLNSLISIPVLPIKIGNLGFLIFAIFVWLAFRLARTAKESAFYIFMHGSFMAICMFIVNDTAKYLEGEFLEFGLSSFAFVIFFFVCTFLLSICLNFVSKKIWKRTFIND